MHFKNGYLWGRTHTHTVVIKRRINYTWRIIKTLSLMDTFMFSSLNSHWFDVRVEGRKVFLKIFFELFSITFSGERKVSWNIKSFDNFFGCLRWNQFSRRFIWFYNQDKLYIKKALVFKLLPYYLHPPFWNF